MASDERLPLEELFETLRRRWTYPSEELEEDSARRMYEKQLFMWDLNFLSSFSSLKSYGDYGLLDLLNFTQKFLEALNRPENPILEVLNIKMELRAKYSFPEIPLLLPPANMVDDDMIPSPDFVLEFIDNIAKNFNLPVVINDPSSWLFVLGPKDQFEEVLNELKLLRFFVLFVSMKCTEPESRHIFLTHVLVQASHTTMVTWLYLPFQRSESQDYLDLSEMNGFLSDLLEMKIKPIRKIYIDVLQDLKLTIQPGLHPYIIPNTDAASYSGFAETPSYSLLELSTGLNDQMEILQEMRSLLRASLIHPPIRYLEFYLQDIDIVIVDAGLLIYSLYDIKGEKEGTTLEDVNRAFGLDLLSNIQPIKEMIYLIIRRTFQSNVPRVHGLGYVDVLLNNLNEFQRRFPDSLASVINQLQTIQEELESTQPFLKDIAEERLGKLQHWATLLIGKAYEVEYIIDACIRKEIPQWCLERWLWDIIEEITHAMAEVEIQRKKLLNAESHYATAQVSSPLPKTPQITEEIVGFEEVRKELREKLLQGCRQLDVLSIVGMPGLGKTTLAYKLYFEESIKFHFDIRAQCCVSQVYKRKELLLSILRDATGESPGCSIDEADVAQKLRRTLMEKRYLILVDDVWEASAWDDLRSCFYDAKNGSRIILTTRHLEVANYAISVSEPIRLRTFNDDESWKLLENRVFGKESCSPHLIEIGHQIAKKCGGLPLSVVLVAGILANLEMKEESWKEVAKFLGSLIHSDSKAIIEQSYQNLPCHLKPCFLYLGAFLEDRVIDSSTITRLWISEAFIKSCKVKSLEDIAQVYLEDLIARNLVMACKRNYLDGKVKAFRIHDILLEFCKKRATEENFLRWIKCDQDANPPSTTYSCKQNAQPRLVYSEADILVEWFSSYSLVGSVIFWRGTEYSKFVISGIFQNFKFLKVLHLDHVFISYFSVDLLHLKYFSAKNSKKWSIPPSISNLWTLETLVIENHYGLTLLPPTIWKLVKLRNLHIFSAGFRVESEEKQPEDSSKLHELRTLSTPYFACVGEAMLMCRKAPNLRELICKFSGDTDSSSSEFCLFEFPTQLEKLHISPHFFNQMYLDCIFPSNLKELRVTEFRMGIQHLSNIGQLQNLQALRLGFITFDDEKWDVSDEDFPKLKVLKLDHCDNLKEWTVADDALPILERLVLDDCSTLEEIPSCLETRRSLKSIEVRCCQKSVVKSAKDIQETQVDYIQKSDFKLSITGYYYSDSDDDEDDDDEEEEEEVQEDEE